VSRGRDVREGGGAWEGSQGARARHRKARVVGRWALSWAGRCRFSFFFLIPKFIFKEL
jgi:hypothetical protein